MKLHRLAPRYRPLLLTTQALYPRWRRLLWNVRLPEPKGLIVVLPRGTSKTRECLLAIAREYQSRGGAIKVLDPSREVE